MSAPEETSPLSDSPAAINKGSLFVIFLTVFIDLLGFGMVLPLLPIYAKRFSTEPSGVQVGLLMASFSAMQFLFAPMWGRISDRIGRRPVLMVGLAGSVIFYTLFGIATTLESLTLIFVARIGAGFAGATISTAQAYIADTTTLQNRAKGMALIGASFGMGFIFGPLLGYLAVPKEIDAAPGPLPGYIAAGLSAIAFGVAIFKLPESLNAKSVSAGKKLFDLKALKAAIATPSVGPLLLCLFVCIFAFANFETTLSMLVGSSEAALNEKIAQIRLNSPFHFGNGKVCLMFSFIGVSLTFAQGFLVRRLAGKVAEGTLATFGAVIEIIGFILLVGAIHVESEPFLFTALFVVVVGFAMMMPSLNSLISRRSDPEKQGAILGVGQSVSSLARIFGPAVAIPMLVQGITIPYYTAAGMMILGLLLVIYSARGGKDYGASSATEQPLGH